MDGRPLPGFHYDPVKRKYFKIANSSDSPIASQYTRSAVEHSQRENAARQQQEHLEERQRKERITRPSVSKSSVLYSAGLERESGFFVKRVQTRAAISEAYASGFREHWDNRGSLDRRNKAKYFTWDEATQSFLIGITTGDEKSILGSQKHHDPSKWTDWSAHEISRVEAFHTEMASLALSPSRTALVCTMGCITKAEACLMKLADPAMFPAGEGPRFDPQVVRFSWDDEDTPWSSAANPFEKNDAVFAVGLSTGLEIFFDAEGGYRRFSLLPSESDVMSVSWLTPSTIMTGQRNGHMYLYDARSGGSSLRLQARSVIAGLRCPDENTVVACGTSNFLAVFDLRMPRETDKTSKSPSKQRRSNPMTSPVMKFSYSNRGSYPVGFDLCLEAGIVAAADDKNRVQIYSMHTGRRVKELFVAEPEEKQANPMLPENPITCLNFVNIDGEDTLMASTGPGIVRTDWRLELGEDLAGDEPMDVDDEE